MTVAPVISCLIYALFGLLELSAEPKGFADAIAAYIARIAEESFIIYCDERECELFGVVADTRNTESEGEWDNSFSITISQHSTNFSALFVAIARSSHLSEGQLNKEMIVGDFKISNNNKGNGKKVVTTGGCRVMK